MQSAPLDQIEITDRQRKEITPAQLVELKRSIVSKGLLHAPVLSYPGPLYRLVAGERRIQAMRQLHEEGVPFTYNGEQVAAFHIPFSLISDLSPVDLQEAELEENLLREPLTWMEEAEARTKIHEMRVAAGAARGEKTSLLSTVKYIAEKQGAAPEEVEKITSNSKERAKLARDIIITQNKDLPAVKAAKNHGEAYRAILDRQEVEMRALLATKTAASNPDLKLLKGDCVEVMKTLRHGQFDVILTDPPYGIGADTMKSDSKHFYKDDADSALRVCREIISQGFNLCKPKATLMMWCDIEHFLPLREFCQQQGWVAWRTPIIWWKGAQGHAPWGRAGFVRTYEVLLFAVKGQRELHRAGGPDVLQVVANARGKTHAAEKPTEILRRLLECAAIQGDHILDPCCGSGPIFEVARRLQLKATGIELSPDYHNVALARLGDIQAGKTAEPDEEDEDDDILGLEDEIEPGVDELIRGRA